jgi:hypothetical protein
MATKKAVKKKTEKKTPAIKPLKKTPSGKVAPKKAVAKKNAPAPPLTAPPTPPSSPAPPVGGPARLRVRMYRQGLGDCFLITFPSNSGEPFYMMIDCGVVLGTPKPQPIMKNVVDDIAAVTKGKIDLLVATHEHWDHLSGFVQAQDSFKKIKVEKAWVAWTENPKDDLANKLREERRATENALRMAVTRLTAFGAADSAARVDSLVGFFGATAGSTSTALANVKAMAGEQEFRTPGEPPITISSLPNVRFWILGPPKDEKLIKKSNPASGEAYGVAADAQAFLMSALTLGMKATDDVFEPDESNGKPFEDCYAIPLARAQHVPFFEQRYFGESGDGSLYQRTRTKGPQGKSKINGEGREIRNQAWRRIDATWLEGSETMALQLDSATNNTSLVIAIELIDSGEILLFPGDAQAGNWLSWQNLKWSLPDGKTVTGPDLLARTIFYKVGHHGSHNATLKAKGLELMVNDALIAMIPVDHEMAVKKRWGMMPLPDLVDRLEKKTHGRVLRVDDKVKTPAGLATLKPADTDAATWKQFTDRVSVTELYYELAF